jgi:lysophospholipase
MREVVLPDCPPPYFALGHSMGATILIRSAQQGRRWFDRAVLCAPMLDILAARRLSKTTVRLMQLMGLGTSYVPAGGATAVALLPFAGNPLTSDPVRYARTAAIVEAEPKVGLGSPTIGWVQAAFSAMKPILDPIYPGELRQPMLVVAAGADQVVSTAAIEQFAIRLRSGSHLIVPGARHEILMEQERIRSQFWAAFDAFVPGSPMFR